CFFFFSSRRRHTRFSRDWSSDVCSSDLTIARKFGIFGLLTASAIGLAACQSGMNSEDRALMEQVRTSADRAEAAARSAEQAARSAEASAQRAESAAARAERSFGASVRK